MALAEREHILEVIDTLANRHLQGKVRAVRLAIIALLSGGHILLEDIPGLGKTTLALALARVLGLSFGRIQCTSDLLPSDITGLSIYRREDQRFEFLPGPIFHNLVLVDEISRAMPKTQSALLEAMEERRVTIEGVTHSLPEPFLVIATQNPVEQIGTFALPESQLDRFSLCTGIGYPPAAVEKAIIRGGSVREQIGQIKPLLSQSQILAARGALREVHLGEKVAEYIHALAEASRTHPAILAGVSTRGAITLADTARAAAYLEGRAFVAPEDVRQVAVAALAHRLILRPEHENRRKEDVLRLLLKELPVPRD
ncbi:AAA family ATPase [Geoalkalibacter sp.]|uniref:AAA family ATPase n=1 Tax=Geoalkalibacter sp. TaxID=3041440 RepID=UPI00272ED869|nr:MoxR family ATPase [Geoalkalibacter sp.]